MALSPPKSVGLLIFALVAGLLVALPQEASAASASASVSPEVVSFTPYRAFDSRTGAKLAAGSTATVALAGRLGVPADAPVVAVNVTVASPAAAGSITVFPCGSARPATPTLFYLANQAVPNVVFAKMGTGGAVCVHTTAQTHVIVDVSNYWRAGAAFTGGVATRALDATLTAGSVRTLPLAGKAGITAGAKAAAVNVTVVSPSAAGSVTVWPCGTKPGTTAVSYTAGRTTSAGVLSPLDAAGKICLAATTAARVQVDVTGHAPASSAYVGVQPVRAAAGTGIAAGGTLALQLGGKFGLPSGAGAAAVTITTVAPATGGDLSVYPCGNPKPGTSTLNFAAGQKVSSTALTRLGANGQVCITSKAATTVNVDLLGYYRGVDIGGGATAVAVQGSTTQDWPSGPFYAHGHSCALMPGGYVKCWGINSSGQLGDGTTLDRPVPVQVKGIIGATAIGAGQTESCAIITGATVTCWGGSFGTSPVAVPGFAGATAISVTGGPCAVIAGTVKCLVNGSVLTKPGLTGVQTLATSGTELGVFQATACAIVTGGSVKCWTGDVDGGGLAGGTAATTVAGVTAATSVAVDSRTQCAAVAATGVLCWGWDRAAQVVPQTKGATSVVNTYDEYGDGKEQITQYGTCALVAGVVTCWGEAHAPGAPITGATSLGHSGAHGCAVVAGGSVKCWGRNTHGEMGNGTTPVSSTPVTVPGLSGATAVASQESKSCAIVAAGQVTCWGGWGFAPAPEGIAGATAIALAPFGLPAPPYTAKACAIVAGGAVPCMGPGITGATAIAMGGETAWDQDEMRAHACAIVAGGAVKCGGHNHVGQLGNGTVGPEFSDPVSVIGITGATALDASGNSTCALLTGGAVKCWGASYGSSPVTVAGITGATGIDAASRCAVVAGGAVRCWSSATGAVTTVAGITGATKIDGQCVIVAGGAVKCFTAGAAATTVAGITGATAIAARGRGVCVVIAGGAVKCWGDNTFGSLGVNPWGPVTAWV